MKFSIIIPAYNLERYIKDCLLSILSQDLNHSDYEIIVINDGSVDDTENIVKNMALENPQIKLINKENEGVSIARNVGIDNAQGDFLMFVDGDDSLETNTFKAIYRVMTENRLELARFGYNITDIQGAIVEINKTSSSIMNGEAYLLSQNNPIFFPWLYVFSKKLLSESKIRFNSNLSFCEDKEFMIRLLSHVKRFQSFDLVRYNYRLERQGGATSVFSNKHLEHLVLANILTYQYANDLQSITLKKYLQDNCQWSIETSFYRLTTESLLYRFGFWKDTVLKSIKHVPGIIDESTKLNLLSKSPTLFYLRHYLPRSIFHKVKNQFHL